MTNPIGRRLTTLAIALSTALVVVTAALVPFLNPWWIAFAQGRAQAADWAGYTPGEVREVTDALLADLVIGPPDFDVQADGVPVLTEAERGHMRDVRTVFLGLWALTAVAAVTLVVAARRADRAAFWRAAGGGAGLLVLAVVGAGLVGLVAFDTLFEAFHRVFFPGGNWAFDPRTDRLVQLFPYRFWFETALAVGGTIVVMAGLVTLGARLARSEGRTPGSTAARPAGDPAR